MRLSSMGENNECVSFCICALNWLSLPLKAREAPVIPVPFFESVGKISAETVYVYPPGCPFLMPGEKISEELLEIVRYYRTSGMEL